MMIPAKKSLGQNFLKSKEALGALVDAGKVISTDTIIEIGPGKGALTKGLLEKAGRVVAIEKDSRLIELLHTEFAPDIKTGKLQILERDILEMSDSEIKKITGGKEYKIIANIPYYITGTLLQKFFETSYQPTTMVLMVQKEVAQRIAARDNKESILSLSVKAYGTPKYIMTVKAKYFSPEPNVDSAIIAVYDISKKFFSDFSEATYFNIIKTAFAHKRKMLVGNLTEHFSREQIEKACVESGISLQARAEDIGLDTWRVFINKLQN